MRLREKIDYCWEWSRYIYFYIISYFKTCKHLRQQNLALMSQLALYDQQVLNHKKKNQNQQ